MRTPVKDQVRNLGQLTILAGTCWALWTFWPTPLANPFHVALWWLGALIGTIGGIVAFPHIVRLCWDIFMILRAFGEDDSKGSAGWLTEKEARKAKLHRRKQGARFAGILGSTPLWVWTETHHLILGPAGTQKTTAAIMNILMGCSESALITDVKGELWETTRKYREKKFGHRSVKIDPKDPTNSIKINPLDRISRAIERDDPAALTCARGMAQQLHPDPQGGTGQNEFFYLGTRRDMVAVELAVSAVMPEGERNLTNIYRAFNDLDFLRDLLEAAMALPALNGEIADMATSMYGSAFGEDGAKKTFEQFRLGALQALEAFGPGNYLAAITSETTLSFRELKEQPLSVYIVTDYSNSSVQGKFAGLIQWLAIDEIVEVGNNKPVLLVLDEFCNAPVYSLPKVLTLLRSFGAKCVLATQDFDDISRVYGNHALETVRSETDIKQILGGIRSKATLAYVSGLLGEYSENSTSFSFNDKGLSESVSRGSRRLMTEDELRRLPDGSQIIIYKNFRPILASKVQVFAVSPWRSKIAPNSLYGGERKLLPVEVRIGWLGSLRWCRFSGQGDKLSLT